MRGDERTGGGTSRDALEYRGLDLETAGGVEVLAHRGYDLRPLDEGLLYLRVHNEVHIPLAVAEFRVREGVENLSVLLFDYRKHAQGLAQQGELLYVDGKLAGLGDEGETLDAHDVAYVEEFLEDCVVHSLVLARADLVAVDVNLYASALVLNFSKGCRSHYPAAHQTACQAEVGQFAFFRIEFFLHFLCGGVYRIKRSRIRFYSQISEFA